MPLLPGLVLPVVVKRTPPHKRKSKRRGKGRGNIQSAVVSVPFRQTAFTITQASSGNGCLSSNDWGVSLTSANTAEFDPYNCGARCKLIASQFAMYRLRKLQARYTPLVGSDGLVETVAGPTTTPSYANRSFAFGAYSDPAVNVTSYASIVESGGVSKSVCRPFTFNIRQFNRSWLFCSTTAAAAVPPTSIDFRLVAPVEFSAAFSSTSTTATATYGFITLEYLLDFKYPLNNATPIGSMPPARDSDSVLVNDDDEKGTL